MFFNIVNWLNINIIDIFVNCTAPCGSPFSAIVLFFYAALYRTEIPYLTRDSESLVGRGLVYISAHLCKCPFTRLSIPRGTPSLAFNRLTNGNVIRLFLKDFLDKLRLCKE